MRPLYWVSVTEVGLRRVKSAISATFERPPPTPGLAVLCQVRSCLPRPVVSGEPRLSPCPAMVRQLTFSTRPALVQVWLMRPAALTPAPGKLRKVLAMLLDDARARKAAVSY